jgi:hypothetical protein
MTNQALEQSLRKFGCAVRAKTAKQAKRKRQQSSVRPVHDRYYDRKRTDADRTFEARRYPDK